MEQLLKQIEDYKNEITAFSAADEKQLEEFRIKYLGTKGIVKAIMGEMKNVPAEQKKEAGQLLNDFKLFVENLFDLLITADKNFINQQNLKNLTITILVLNVRLNVLKNITPFYKDILKIISHPLRKKIIVLNEA